MLGLVLLAGPVVPTTAVAAEAAPSATVEEQRLDRPVPREILERSGFDAVTRHFTRALGAALSYAEARKVVVREGSGLWRRAVDRAQGRGPAGGDLSRDDDRPLYWARLGMTREVRTWEPSFGLTDAQRTALLGELERTSRGQDAVRYPAGQRLKRALRPYLRKVDLFTTVSQGRVGRFDVERTNGAWRGGFPDNENIGVTGTVPVGDPASQPQWTTTTLPYKAIVAADTGRFPVYDNTSVTEIPAGGTEAVVRPDGPTEGSTARAGGGGNYLSNEIAYRATLLRDRLGLHDVLPGGHVHTPVLEFGAGNTDPATGAVTDPGFVRNRVDIIAQVRAIVAVAVGA